MSRVVLAGSSGLIGTALAAALRDGGDDVVRLVRRAPESADEVRWDPDGEALDPGVLEGADALVSLGGASIARIPWTPRYKSRLLWSRLTPTRVLAQALGELSAAGSAVPSWASASASGFYGTMRAGKITERAGAGSGFLAALCREWEDSARRAAGVTPVALLRTAPVLHPDGVLAPLMALTRAGAGGPLGTGRQSWPWISLDDVVGAIRHTIDRRHDGPVNLTGPVRASMNEIGFRLAMRMNRPYLVRAPAFALRTALGVDFADGLLLTDVDAVPGVLKDTGYAFVHPTVADTIQAVVPEG